MHNINTHSQRITLSTVYLIIILSVHNSDGHNKFVHYRMLVYRNKYLFTKTLCTIKLCTISLCTIKLCTINLCTIRLCTIISRPSWASPKIIAIKGLCCYTGVPNFISMSQAVYELSGFEMLKIRNIYIHAHTSGRQLKITFLDFLQGRYLRCPSPILMILWHVVGHRKTRHTWFFLSAEKRF